METAVLTVKVNPVTTLTKAYALNLLRAETENWMKKAMGIYNVTLSMPPVDVNIKGCCAGRARLAQWAISYNYELFIQNQQEFIERTVPHEVAHMIVYQVFGREASRRHHGRYWKMVMNRIGAKHIERCHSYDTSRVHNPHSKQARNFVYKCGCKEHILTSIRHRRIIQQGQKYFCRACKGAITFVEVRV
jgi:SprT protein